MPANTRAYKITDKSTGRVVRLIEAITPAAAVAHMARETWEASPVTVREAAHYCGREGMQIEVIGGKTEEDKTLPLAFDHDDENAERRP